MELVEGHAYDSYNKYSTENAAELKAQPAPQIAIQYYRNGDLYMFDEFQTGQKFEPRRPSVNNLYDVFVNIRDDEQEHVKTMTACQRANAQLTFKSPHSQAQLEATRS